MSAGIRVRAIMPSWAVILFTVSPTRWWIYYMHCLFGGSGIWTQASCLLGRHSTTWATSSPIPVFIKCSKNKYINLYIRTYTQKKFHQLW
jgi:hypothetical protein